ncbi:MAG: hypothetical protein QOD44_4329 [Solirubrobacteraceae bacterium]|nr:hypothetical protein [Solirubrobacteraceae bacterium]MEA2320140.1 hypothetical protein [Solirubrobacteraceae bacterium]
MSSLLEPARAWVAEVHPHARHLLRTEHWALQIDPGARDELRLAAVLHDIERAFPDPAAPWVSWRDWRSPEYNRWHQDRCAGIASTWLSEQGAEPGPVAALIAVHEEGGWPEADILQAADSLSFLETMVPLVLRWPRESAEAKLADSVGRMAPGMARARELAVPMLADAQRALEQASAGEGAAR